MKFTFKILVISYLSVFVLFFWVGAQPTNEQAFHKLILENDSFHGRPVREFKGFLTDYMKTVLVPDSLATPILNISTPEVKFSKAGKKIFEREVSVEIVYVDSSQTSYSFTHKDTVARDQLSRIRKTKYSSLRGNDPRAISRFILPGIGIATGIATIITLFYLRS